MTSTGQIDYRVRPNKAVERRMLIETFGRLRLIDSLSSYCYIGFGSVAFVDFLHIHRSLGLTDLTSIERDTSRKKRYEANVPYAGMHLIFGHSNTELPKLKWTKRSIVWLDYDYPLDLTVLADIDVVASKAVPGSFLVITVNAEPGPANGSRRPQFVEEVGAERVPFDVTGDADLAGWGKADAQYRLITDQLVQALRDRSAGQPKEQVVTFRQILHFRYADDARMLTIGGIIGDSDLSKDLAAARFEEMAYYRQGKKPFLIDIPTLTPREILSITQQLPGDSSKIVAPGIGKEQLRSIADTYRQLPIYFDVEM
jgi:hypothetical protein